MCGAGKVLHFHITDIAYHEPIGHTFHVDDVAHDGQGNGFFGARPADGDVHLGALGSAQFLHRVAAAEIESGLPFNFNNLVATLNTHVIGRSAFDGRNHRGVMVANINGDAEAAKFTFGGHHQVFVIDRRQIVGMLIKGFEHALDTCFHNFLGVFFIHIIVDDALVGFAQNFQVIVEVPAPGGGVISRQHSGAENNRD